MKKIGALILAIILLIAFILPYINSGDVAQDKDNVSFGFESSNTFLSIGQGVPFEFECSAVDAVDRIELILDGVIVKEWVPKGAELVFSVNTEQLELGSYAIEVRGYVNDVLVNNDERVLFVNSSAPLNEQEFELLSTHPHNPKNFTQGYAFDNDVLYESTGNPSQTSATMVAKIDPETGASILERKQPNPIFGEGITILNSKLYQVSWQDQKCFVYDALNLIPIDTMEYIGEGWGLCNDGKSIIMSNGTNKLTFRNPENFEITQTIQVHSDRGPVTNLNELEFFNGRIFANIWIDERRFQHDSRMNLGKIVVINPKSGAVEAFLNINEILQLASAENVPNGIAYRKKTNSFWLTGKYWNQVFEIKLSSKSK